MKGKPLLILVAVALVFTLLAYMTHRVTTPKRVVEGATRIETYQYTGHVDSDDCATLQQHLNSPAFVERLAATITEMGFDDLAQTWSTSTVHIHVSPGRQNLSIILHIPAYSSRFFRLSEWMSYRGGGDDVGRVSGAYQANEKVMRETYESVFREIDALRRDGVIAPKTFED